MNKAEQVIWRAGLREKMLKTTVRNLFSLRVPPQFRGLRETIDLTCLYADSARSVAISPSIYVEALNAGLGVSPSEDHKGKA